MGGLMLFTFGIIFFIVLLMLFPTMETFAFALIIAVVGGVALGVSGRFTQPRRYTATCHFCGYTWQMRRPHTIWNPPSRCPNCGKKILRESEFLRTLEENRKKLNEETRKKMNGYQEFREKLRNDFSKNESKEN